VLTSKEHKKLFLVLANETNFMFRADMAEALGLLTFKFETKTQEEEARTGQDQNQEVGQEEGDGIQEKPLAITKEQFKEHYMDVFIDLLNDSDNIVQLKSVESAAKLIGHDDGESFIDQDMFIQEIQPQFLRFLEQVSLDDDALQQFSAIFGEVIYRFHLKFST